ncbi:MAG: hypothetical protein ABSD28_07080 [Tepidisphaeraceae bacterium]
MLVNPERLFEKSWRPRHPLRRQHSAARRHCMAGLLLFLCIIIFGYIYLTDVQRVRGMASAYLSDLLGGEVTIGTANLSIFEGLRLDDVTLRVDKTNQPDSIIFHARTFLIRYHPAELLAGRLSATQIIAIGPVVMLVENQQTHRWNYQRMWRGAGRPPRRSPLNGAAGPMVVPQIILRDAEVAYMELRDGKTVPLGWYSIEGSLNPNDEEPDRYDFQLQSRGREAMGPSADGTIRTEGGISVAHMQNFRFGPDMKTMLLAEPRQWCEWHQLQGRIEVPEMVYNPNPGGGGPIFHAELVLSDVEMVVHPEEWMSREQNHRVLVLHDFLDMAESRRWFSHQFVEAVRRLSTPEPVRFTQVSGNLLFTQAGIELRGISGKVESNWFNIDGQLEGYSPDAPAHVTISSVTGHDLEIPDLSPDYLGTLPKEAQDLIEHVHPHGTCAMRLDIQRREPGGKPIVTGQIDIKDGQFRAADFPYPVSRVHGRVLIGPDPIAGMSGIRLFNLEGHGPADGPNADAQITLNGFVGPLEGISGVWLEVNGNNVVGDSVVRGALPPPAQTALELFDPEGRGEFPKFHGNFSCTVRRMPGPRQPWQVNTDLAVDDAEGTLAAFPYPLKHFSCRLEVRDGYLNVVNGRMRHGAGTLGVEGIVRWKTDTSPPTTQPDGPDLRISARDLPIDEDLTSALPRAQRLWVQNVGLSGALDFDGRVFPGNGPKNVNYFFDASLRDGAIQPGGGEAAMSGLTGKLHLTPSRLEIDDLAGRRGAGSAAAHAVIDWSGEPKISLSAAARKLDLSPSLYRMLPQRARQGWDAVLPQGDVDATLELADTFGAPPQRLELHVIPRDLSVTPAAIPYRLDNVQGDILISPAEVVLRDLKATHGRARIALSGGAKLDRQPAWDLQISASSLAVDDELLTALPDSVAAVFRGLKVGGNIDVDLSKLEYWPEGQHTTTQPGGSGPDVDFAAKITLRGTSLEVGLPATDVQANVDLAGLVRGGKLHRLAGQCAADSFLLAGRSASDVKLTLAKNSDDPEVDVTHVEGKFASGDLAGQGDYVFSDTDPSRYDVNLILRDADVQQLTTPYEKDLKGRLTASLQLGGTWNDPSSRRGHGDISVYGERMYNIPVMLGLMQITNLALPLHSPFSQISTRYTLEGQKVVFERIELKSNDMTMSGSGEIVFALKRVSLWLATNNPTLIALPVLGPLLSGANQELLRIHVKGTIEQPTVSASTFDTVTTTVDQVFKGTDQEH